MKPSMIISVLILVSFICPGQDISELEKENQVLKSQVEDLQKELEKITQLADENAQIAEQQRQISLQKQENAEQRSLIALQNAEEAKRQQELAVLQQQKAEQNARLAEERQLIENERLRIAMEKSAVKRRYEQAVLDVFEAQLNTMEARASADQLYWYYRNASREKELLEEQLENGKEILELAKKRAEEMEKISRRKEGGRKIKIEYENSIGEIEK